MKHFLRSSLLIILSATLLCSCSNETDEQEPQKESYQSQSEQIGHEAAEAIKVPMEKAENAVDIENERMKEYEKSLKE